MTKPEHIRIGTRSSPLARWQAEMVARQLNDAGIETSVVFINSEGDQDLSTPLYEMGIQGIFTRALDQALLTNKIDVAVHSLKDVPTRLASGISLAAVLKRGNPYDIIIWNRTVENPHGNGIIGTGSLRRALQWKQKFPQSQSSALRGNIQTRLSKLHASGWQGALFAAAAIERLQLPEAMTGKQEVLSWMLPAPGQGAVAVCAKTMDEAVIDACAMLNDASTSMCTGAERALLRALDGGCSTPLGALAVDENNMIRLRAKLVSADGTRASHFDAIASKARIDTLIHDAVSMFADEKLFAPQV